MKVPYHHANVDSDEVLFYVDGDFMSRAGIRHRRRIDHACTPPASCTARSPAASSARSTPRRTEEVAVMLDTFRPLRVTAAARATSAEGYHLTWSG